MWLMCSKQPGKLAVVIQVLLLLCYGVGNIHGSTIHENSIDLHSLLDFKLAVTDDPKGALVSWNTSVHYCRWNGVMCTTTRPWRVMGLNLTAQSLAGEITSSLANLTFLTSLDLSSNRFFGQFPLLKHLEKLDTLYMNGNSLDRITPDTLTNCSNLRQLDLSKNLLQGGIPPSIGSLTNLDYLDISKNLLQGGIPPSISSLTNLGYLDLSINNLTGMIPRGLWQLPSLSSFILAENMLSGGIPHALNMSLLQTLDLDSNMLGEELPPNIGDALPSLQQLSLFSNNFEGHIPTSLGNALDLQLIDLAANNFSGQIPPPFGRLSKLSRLNLENNKLEASDNQGWEFLHELRNCISLKLLSLGNNNLQGSVEK